MKNTFEDIKNMFKDIKNASMAIICYMEFSDTGLGKSHE